ncbi:hypothetical protein FACS189434_03680 [Bacteroidia bacterium]|nr:hypothetical protein FACS189434_03680 [Bacteroidia bacterium]
MFFVFRNGSIIGRTKVIKFFFPRYEKMGKYFAEREKVIIFAVLMVSAALLLLWWEEKIKNKEKNKNNQ